MHCDDSGSGEGSQFVVFQLTDKDAADMQVRAF